MNTEDTNEAIAIHKDYYQVVGEDVHTVGVYPISRFEYKDSIDKSKPVFASYDEAFKYAYGLKQPPEGEQSLEEKRE